MATVQPPHVAPRRHHPPPPPVPPPEPAPSPAVVTRPQLPQHCHAADVARGRNRTEEGVADSCFPCPPVPALVDLDSGSDDEDDDGCGSCVDGGGSGEGRDDDEQGSGSVVAWWSQESSSRRCFLRGKGSRTAEEDIERAGREDPKVAAVRRQEEDRKFWEACLASGYP